MNATPNALAFTQLLDLVGYWQDGSATTVVISTDDAVNCYVLQVGKQIFTGTTLSQAIAEATAANPRD